MNKARRFKNRDHQAAQYIIEELAAMVEKEKKQNVEQTKTK